MSAKYNKNQQNTRKRKPKFEFTSKTVKLKRKIKKNTKMLQKPKKTGKNSPKKPRNFKKNLTFTVITVKVEKMLRNKSSRSSQK